MDFFLNLLIGPATAEATTDLDTEVKQVPVDSACIVA